MLIVCYAFPIRCDFLCRHIILSIVFVCFVFSLLPVLYILFNQAIFSNTCEKNSQFFINSGITDYLVSLSL